MKINQKKILFISGNLSDGGAQRVIAVVSSALANRNYNVSLLLFSRNDKEYSVDHKVKLYSISNSYADYERLSLFKRILLVREYLKSIDPDVAVGFLEGGYALYLASVCLSLKKVASARITPQIILNAKGLRAMINRMWFRNADAVVLQTDSQKNLVDRIDWKNKVVIPNPVSSEALERSQYSYNMECRRILMVGRLTPQKNFNMVIEAIKTIHEKHPDIALDIFGVGALENELMSLIKKLCLDGTVTLRGWSQNILDEYMNADLFIMSSNFEGMPNALMEAMAIGLPCIATNCDTGPADLISDGINGFLIPVGDKETLIRTIMHVIKMTPQDREKIGKNARYTMQEHYSIRTIVAQWEMLFKQLETR